MKIVTLVENQTINKEYKNKHGLSFYIEWKDKKILFDLGPDSTFLENAKKLGIDISAVDMAIVSHGHMDHGGGLATFLENNKKAKIYIKENAYKDYYSSILNLYKVYIGLDKTLKENSRLVFTDDYYEIEEGLTLFSNVKIKSFFSSCNNSLLKKEENAYLKDDFKHEQNLILKEGENSILISGCSHCGIINILDKALEINSNINVAVGGLHLCKPSTKITEKETFIKALGEAMKETEVKFYTGHCTGDKPYKILKEILKNNIEYLKTGSEMEI